MSTVCLDTISRCRYEDKLIGKSKAEQVNNPAFARQPMDTELLYKEQMQKLAGLTARINESMQLRLCLDNQEPDCIPQRVLCIEPQVVADECTGSGCGSAEEESSSGLGDLEDGDEEGPEQEHEDINRPNSDTFEDKWTPDPDPISPDDLDTDPIVIFNDTDPRNDTEPNVNNDPIEETVLNDDYDPILNDDYDPIVIISDSDPDGPPITDDKPPKLPDNRFDSGSPPIHRLHYLLFPMVLFALYLL